jgi:hypothetical protein
MQEPSKQRTSDRMSTAINHGSTQMKKATLLKPSLLQSNQTSLSSRVSVRVSKPSKVAADEKTKLEHAEKLNRRYAGFPEPGGYQDDGGQGQGCKSGTVPPAGG